MFASNLNGVVHNGFENSSYVTTIILHIVLNIIILIVIFLNCTIELLCMTVTSIRMVGSIQKDEL